jgi:hypothetical protein
MSNNKKPKVETRWGPKITFPPAVFLLIALWIYALAWAWSGHPIYRDQHIGAALEYASNGIDLLRPIIVGFNASGTATPQELPLWQAAASLGLSLFGGWWGGATIASLVLFTILLPCFYQTAKWETDAAFAWLTVAFLLAQPIVFHLAGGAQTDGLSLALLIGFIWSAELLRRKPRLSSWLLCAAMASLLAVTKLPFLLAGGIAAALYLLWQKEGARSWLLLAGAGIFSAVLFYFWNDWGGREIARAEFPFRKITVKDNPWWFFGDLAFRLDPANYIKAGWRSLSCLWGSFVLVGLTIYGLILRPRSLGAALLVGALVTTLIFTRIILVHRHYYLLFSPAVALLNTYAVAHILHLWSPRRTLVSIFGMVLGAALLGLSLLQGLVQIEALNMTPDPYMKKTAAVLAAQTSPQDKLLVLNGGWGGDLLIHAERRGLSINSTAVAEDPHTRARLKQLGYNKLVIASESPLLHAVQMTNPGEGHLQRIVWPAFATPEVLTWQIDHRSDDLLIVSLPD